MVNEMLFLCRVTFKDVTNLIPFLTKAVPD